MRNARLDLTVLVVYVLTASACVGAVRRTTSTECCMAMAALKACAFRKTVGSLTLAVLYYLQRQEINS